MGKRDDLIEVLEGGTPSRTPYTVLDWNMDRAISSEDVADRMRNASWRRLLDLGLTIRHHCAVTRAVEHGVEYTIENRTEGDDEFCIETKKTPVGAIRKIMRNRWLMEPWLKSPKDYKTARWIVEHTEILPDYDAFELASATVGQQGYVALTGHGRWLHRTPLMSVCNDDAGAQQFCLDLAMEVPELFDLIEARTRLFMEEQRLIASSPGRYVIWYENLAIEMLGPNRYAELMMPVYRRALAIHEAADKRLLVHYDGNTRQIADKIAAIPFPIIDSLSEPPEGDMMLDQGRTLWPDKTILANISVSLYARPAEELRQAVIDKRRRAGKKAFAFEISEDTPENWNRSIPVVLQTLAQLD